MPLSMFLEKNNHFLIIFTKVIQDKDLTLTVLVKKRQEFFTIQLSICGTISLGEPHGYCIGSIYCTISLCRLYRYLTVYSPEAYNGRII
jgi:hypothetical protein